MLREAEQQGWLGPRASAQNVWNALAVITASTAPLDTMSANQQGLALLERIHSADNDGILSEGIALLKFRLPGRRY